MRSIILLAAATVAFASGAPSFLQVRSGASLAVDLEPRGMGLHVFAHFGKRQRECNPGWVVCPNNPSLAAEGGECCDGLMGFCVKGSHCNPAGTSLPCCKDGFTCDAVDGCPTGFAPCPGKSALDVGACRPIGAECCDSGVTCLPGTHCCTTSLSGCCIGAASGGQVVSNATGAGVASSSGGLIPSAIPAGNSTLPTTPAVLPIAANRTMAATTASATSATPAGLTMSAPHHTTSAESATLASSPSGAATAVSIITGSGARAIGPAPGSAFVAVFVGAVAMVL